MTVIKNNLAIHEDKNREWDSGEAIARIKEWATNDDGNIDFDQYRQAFFWVDSEDEDIQGNYKLPFADVFDDELQAVWRGVAAAMGALQGARGGVDVPESDKKTIYTEISKYYEKFEEEPPEMKDSQDKSTKKGALAEAIHEEDMFEKKMQMMEPFREVVYAFYDVYYDEDTPFDDFNTLLAELIGLLKQILNGNYSPSGSPSEDDPIEMAIHEGVDKEKVLELIQGKQVKEKTVDKSATEKFFTKATIEKSNDDGSFTAIASTSMVDRHGESVSPDGWDLKNFKNNPVLLWAHDHTIPAIGKATKVWVDGKGKSAKLMFSGVWQTVTEHGKAASQLVSEGILNSFSVGFMPYDMDGNTYTKQELLEISLVNVPANPQAMMLAYKSLKKSGFEEKTMKDIGINVELLDKLDVMEKDISTLTDKVNTLVKAQANKDTSAAPQMQLTKQARARQSLAKTIAKASDTLLQGEKQGNTSQDRIKMAKIVKRASEILISSQKNHG